MHELFHTVGHLSFSCGICFVSWQLDNFASGLNLTDGRQTGEETDFGWFALIFPGSGCLLSYVQRALYDRADQFEDSLSFW